MKLSKITHLPAALKQLRSDIIRLQQDVLHQQDEINEINASKNFVSELSSRVEDLADTSGKLMQRSSELEHVVSVSQRNNNPVTNPETVPLENERFVDNHLLDQFYIELENNFRGTEDEIQKKQEPYLEYFKKSTVNFKKYPVIDLGSGRGEFISLLSENGIRGIGVDLNESMVERMLSKKLEAVAGDAIEYLANCKSESIGAIVGFHIAEHIPFDQLMSLIAEARRVLAKGGFLLLETPNPENISVGAFTFHYDPSHLKPVPPAILDFMAKFKGFSKTDILRLQPEFTESEINKATSNIQLRTTLKRVHGPRDYALIAYK